MDPFISIEELFFTYSSDGEGPARIAIDGLSLEIEKGSFVAVVGRNGSGKSTLAKNLNALLLPSGGAVCVKGMFTSDGEKLWDIRETIGMVFQNPDNQLVSSIVEDDVAFGPENLGVESSEIRKRVDAALRAVNMYEERKKGAHLLSGGQKQRVAIAGVLAMEPECIIFDEATSMLDPAGRREVMEIIETLHSQGTTVIMISHFMEEAARAERIVVMDKGRLVMDAPPRVVFARKDELYEIDLELPFAADLAARLSAEGLAVPAGIIDEKELADWLCTLR